MVNVIYVKNLLMRLLLETTVIILGIFQVGHITLSGNYFLVRMQWLLYCTKLWDLNHISVPLPWVSLYLFWCVYVLILSVLVSLKGLCSCPEITFWSNQGSFHPSGPFLRVPTFLQTPSISLLRGIEVLYQFIWVMEP